MFLVTFGWAVSLGFIGGGLSGVGGTGGVISFGVASRGGAGGAGGGGMIGASRGLGSGGGRLDGGAGSGALTLGTLDGANVEIRDRVGPDNIFIFGITAEQVQERRSKGIDARETIAGSLPLQRALDAIGSGLFSPSEPDRFRDLVDVVTYHDHFLVSADFEAYAAAQREVAAKWRDQAAWWRSSILNTAGVGWFSSDRAIREYCDNVWNVKLST